MSQQAQVTLHSHYCAALTPEEKERLAASRTSMANNLRSVVNQLPLDKDHFVETPAGFYQAWLSQAVHVDNIDRTHVVLEFIDGSKAAIFEPYQIHKKMKVKVLQASRGKVPAVGMNLH